MTISGLRFSAVLLLCALALPGRQLPAAAQPASSPQPQTAPATGATRAIDTSRWKTYRNEKYGFELKYPETWVVNPASESADRHVEIVSIAHSYAANDPAPHAAFNLAIQPNENPQRLSIEQWFAGQLQAMKATPASQGDVTIGGQAAVFMENANSLGTHRDTFTLLHETDLLSLSYTRHPEFDSTYAAVISSFRIVK